MGTQFSQKNDHLITIAMYEFFKGNFESALEKVNKWQSYVTETQGGFLRGLFQGYKLKIKCYAKLKNKKMAKKCLKQFKKFLSNNETDERYLEMKKLVDSIISPKGQQKVVGQVKSLSKCC